MTAAAGITTSGQPPTAVVNIQPGMNVQAVVLVDQNGQYVTSGGGSGTATTLASLTTGVNVSNATAPTSGQVLTATSGTAATWQTSSTGFANPMTTAGDIIAENTTPTAVRVSGNTTATKNFLTQTGTGSASALPVWGTIAAADMPAGTTGAKGALQLDGTASDIANTGPQAAGSIGKAADAGHVHFSSGQYLCTPAAYAPGGRTTLATPAATTVAAGSNGGEISTVASWSSPSAGVLDVATTSGWPTSGTFTVATSTTTATCTYTGTAAGQLTGVAYVSGSATGTVATGGAVTLASFMPVSSANVNTGSFTAPASGSVVVSVSLVAQTNVANSQLAFALASHGTFTLVGSNVMFDDNGTSIGRMYSWQFLVTGLTPGSSYNFDLMMATASGVMSVFAQGVSSNAPVFGAGNQAPVTMTVQAV